MLRCQAGEHLERTGEALKIRRKKASSVCQVVLAWRSTKRHDVLPLVFISASRGNGRGRKGGREGRQNRASGVACVLTPLKELSSSDSTSAFLSSNPRSAKKKKKKKPPQAAT